MKQSKALTTNLSGAFILAYRLSVTHIISAETGILTLRQKAFGSAARTYYDSYRTETIARRASAKQRWYRCCERLLGLPSPQLQVITSSGRSSWINVNPRGISVRIDFASLPDSLSGQLCNALLLWPVVSRCRFCLIDSSMLLPANLSLFAHS